MPVDIHRRMLNLRPEQVRVYLPREKPRDLNMSGGQRRWHKAAETINKLDGWVRVEMYDAEGKLLEAINVEETFEDEETELGGRSAEILALLSKNNRELMGTIREMFGDIIGNYAELARTAVERANKAERAWMNALDELASIGTAPESGGNGQSVPDQIIAQILPMLLQKFAMSGTGNIAKLQAEVSALEAAAKAGK